VIATDGVDPWAGVSVQTRLNGELKQDGTTSDFIFKIDRIIHHISQFCTLLPGDIIATGTPAGISAMNAGDLVEVFVEGVGILRNTVVDEK
jgi:2-keto-4-pentenoate hydratase/2-oxohepta-3-ene-1,7-dioic acid hydratase in catechol pathway